MAFCVSSGFLASTLVRRMLRSFSVARLSTQCTDPSVIHILRSRGFIEAMTHDIEKMSVPFKFNEEFLLNGNRVSVYAGFDPTAKSLHLGNLLVLMTLAHFQRHGYSTICLLGGATGMIGDPSGKSSERILLSEATIEQNIRGIGHNISRFLANASLESEDQQHACAVALNSTPVQTVAPLMLNNFDWTSTMSAITFLRDVGKHFRLSAMISKDSVKSRMEGDGMSFTEFSYQLLQANDFYHLYTNHNCRLQIGGSDQWGNIVAGCELIRKRNNLTGSVVTNTDAPVEQNPALGLTIPLLTTSTGEKFGKSAGNAIWLDAKLTSPYHLYQYMIATPDDQVARLLALFTFLSMDYISKLVKQHALEPHLATAQQTLASRVTRLVHGTSGLRMAQRATAALFGRKPIVEQNSITDTNPSSESGKMTTEEWCSVLNGMPQTALSLEELRRGVSVTELAVRCGAVENAVMSGKMIQQGGCYINNVRVLNAQQLVTTQNLVDDVLCVLRIGKKSQFVLMVTDSSVAANRHTSPL